VVAKVGQKLSVHKRADQKFDRERFKLRKPNDVGVKEMYQVKISNKFAALENLMMMMMMMMWISVGLAKILGRI
jgi:hypothetical protein